MLLQLFFIYGFTPRFGSTHAHSTSTPKIAIIGGGIGGTATAYFLREFFEENVQLDLYEPNQIGGRLATTHIEDREFETGGSIIHTQNKYMKAFVQKFALKMRESCPMSRLGIFNGKEYLFTESSWEFMTLAKLFYRYGLDVFWLKRRNDAMLKAFSSIYKTQNSGISFDTVEELLSSMDASFPSQLKVSMRQHLEDLGYHSLIIDELIAAITLTNYGQTPDIHSFVGSIAIAGGDGNLWAIRGGNKRVPEVLLKDSEAVLHKAAVTSISPLSDNKFRVTSLFSHEEKGSEKIQDYDAVAIATPLSEDHNSIKFTNFTQEFHFPGRYQRIVCTMVQGQPNALTFKFKELGFKIDEILVVDESLMYNSVGLQRPVDNKPENDCQNEALQVYKVFSPEPLSELQLSTLFNEHTTVRVVDWLAYPHYESNETTGSFTLLPGLYYNNAIEKAASAMEMSAIAARNVALLIFKNLGGSIEEYLAKDEL